VLRVEALTASYGEPGEPSVQGVTLEVEAGQILAILGPNGAGKSSLLKALCGRLRVLGGNVRLGDLDLLALPPHRLASHGIVYVPQGQRVRVFESMTVRENLEMAGYSGARVDRRRLEQALEVFPRLRPLLGTRAGRLSGGERQMVAMARTLLTDARLLLIDEPSLGLAPDLVDELYARLVLLKTESRAVVLVDQNAGCALSVADRVCLLSGGRVARVGLVGEGNWENDLLELCLEGEALEPPTLPLGPGLETHSKSALEMRP
jgi:branched-chain amino acid transport system ATP-binding protein